MTAPAVVGPGKPPRVLSGDEWQQAQYAPHRTDEQQDPTKPMAGGRALTGDEWEQSQRAPDFSALKFPAMPKMASDRLGTTGGSAIPGQYDMRPSPERQAGAAVRSGSAALDVAAPSFGAGGALIAHSAAAVGRQVVAPAVENPALTAAMVNPVGAIVGFGMAAHTIAKYGWQQAHEAFMSPEDKAKAEADPDRVSGEAAAVQAVMLGLGTLAGAHAISKAADVSEGMTEAAASDMARASAGTSPTDPAFTAARIAEGRATVALRSQAGPAAAGAEHAREPLTTPVVPTRGGQPAEAPIVPTTGQAEEFPPTLSGGRGKEATALTEEQRSGKAVPVVEPQTFSTGGGESRIPQRGRPISYFSTPKGADVLGTAAATHGLADTANPFPPGSPLGEMWANGHASVTGEPPATPYKGPASLYNRLSNDALGAEYRALIEKRAAEQPNAQAPLWTPEREAAAVEQIENRRRPDGSLSPADKSRLANLQAAQGEEYYVGRHTFESAAAERRVAQLDKHITAIETEMAGRGIKPEEAMQPPAGEGGAPQPVEGTGEVKTRGLSAGIEAKAVEHGMEPLDMLPEYRSLNMADQAQRAVQFITDNPEQARKVALGEASAPEGLHPVAVTVAVENKALAEGDVATIRDLAASRMTEKTTTAAQHLRILGERDPDSPVGAIQRIEEARGGKANGKAINDAVTELRGHLDAASATIDESAWTKFIDSIRC